MGGGTAVVCEGCMAAVPDCVCVVGKLSVDERARIESVLSAVGQIKAISNRTGAGGRSQVDSLADLLLSDGARRQESDPPG